MENLQNQSQNQRVVLLTGAGKGIGKAIFRALVDTHQAGTLGFKPKIAIASRTPKDLEALVEFAGTSGVEILAHPCDLAAPGAPQALYEACRKRLGRVDILINNAGVGRFGSFLELSEEDVEFELGTNLKATFLLTQAVYREMAQQKSGQIVFITSVAAEKPFEQSAIYCMSKFGQKGFLEVLRLYGHRDHVRITNIEPGAVLTPMWGAEGDALKDRMMMPSDIAQAVLAALRIPERASIEEIVIRPIAGDL